MGHRRAHLPGEFQPKRVDVGDHDMPRSGVPHHRHRHQPDRPGPRDEHIFTEHVEAQSRMHRIAERIEDRRHIAVDIGGVVPDIRHRQGEILRKGARPVHAHALRRLAEVAAAGETVAAATADDMPFPRHDVAREEVVHIGADGDDLADELVPDRHRHGNRFLGPGVPGVDMQIGAADPGAVDADQHIIDADLRHRHRFQPQPRPRLPFHKRLHGVHVSHHSSTEPMCQRLPTGKPCHSRR